MKEMPFYRFICTSKECGYETKKLLTKSEADKFGGACVCGLPLVLAAGRPEARAMETGDEYRDKSVVSGVKDLLAERSKEHFRKHELPRIIAEKGIEYAKENGFVDEDGNPK